MRQILLVLFCLTFFSSYAQFRQRFFTDEYINSAREVLAANIKKEYIYNFAVNKKKIVDSFLISIINYNEKGNVISREDYNKNNDLTYFRRYFYNSKGQLVRSINESIVSKIIGVIEYEYDSLGRVIYQYDYNKDTTQLTVYQKIYDSLYPNQVKQLLRKFNSSSFYSTRENNFDEKGRIIREVAFDQAGNQTFTNLTEYDDKHHSKSVFLENSDGRTKQSETIFDSLDHPVRLKSYHMLPTFRSLYDFRQEVTTKHFTYNNNRTLYELKFSVDGQLIQFNRHYYFQD